MINTQDITKYIAACADRAHVSVVWFTTGGCPRTDGKTMWLPAPTSTDNERSMVELRQFVKHETSHVLYSDFDLLNKNKPEGLLAIINNILEDHRIDYLNDSEFVGDKNNTIEYWGIYCDDVSKMDKASVPAEHKDELAPMFAWDLAVRQDLWAHAVDPFTSLMSEKGKKAYDKLMAGDYGKVLGNIRQIKDKTEGGKQVWDLAMRILREVFEQTPEQAKKKAKGEGGEGKGKGKSGGKDGKDKDGKPKKGEGIPAPYSEHEGMRVGGSKEVSPERGTYTPTPYGDTNEWDFVSGTGTMSKPRITSYSEDEARAIAEASAKGMSLASQIRTHLQIISRDRWEYGQKKGKLNNSSLYRVGIKDAKGLNERLFKNKVNNKVLDVAVQVLVDASGSMTGQQFQDASAAAVILNDVLGNNLNIPLEILAFTEFGSTMGKGTVNTMYTLKRFDTRVMKESLCSSFGMVSQTLCDNVDGESLMYGFNRIRNRKEKRKMMIVLSDGAPYGGRHRGGLVPYTKKVIEHIEKSPVELIGMGLDYDGVDKYYKNSVSINGRDVERALLTVITNNILRTV